MADIKLESLSKVDLIWLIRRMQQWPMGDSAYRHAVTDLECKKNMERINEADRLLGISIEANKQVADILRPYDGQRMVDIPLAVLEQADKCSKRAERAYKTYLKLSEANVK